MASLPQRKDGRYYSRVNIGRGDNGTIKYKYFYGKTQKEVREQERAYTTDLDTYGRPLDNNKITLQDWGYNIMYSDIFSVVGSSTFSVYVNAYEKHIKDSTIGKMAIKDIRQMHLQKYFNDKKNFSKSLLARLKHLLGKFFKLAVSNNIIRVSPIDDVKLPTSDVKIKEIDILTLEEQRAYTEALKGHNLEMLFLTALYTGMRQGELIALKWHSVNFDDKTIEVCESYKRVRVYDSDGSSEGPVLVKKKPKTESGIRTIPIPSFLCSELKKHKLQNPKNEENLVFVTKKGNLYSAMTLSRLQKLICLQAKIRPQKNDNGDITYKGISFHALRHTYATRLIEHGIDVKTVSQILGHSDITTTLNTYVHSTDSTKKAAADTLDLLYKRL